MNKVNQKGAASRIKSNVSRCDELAKSNIGILLYTYAYIFRKLKCTFTISKKKYINVTLQTYWTFLKLNPFFAIFPYHLYFYLRYFFCDLWNCSCWKKSPNSWIKQMLTSFFANEITVDFFKYIILVNLTCNDIYWM